MFLNTTLYIITQTQAHTHFLRSIHTHTRLSAPVNPTTWFCMHSCLSQLFFLYFLYVLSCHFVSSSQKPVVVGSKAFSAFLHTYCPVVAECFSPTPWCWGSRLQTLVCAFLKSRPPTTYRKWDEPPSCSVTFILQFHKSCLI